MEVAGQFFTGGDDDEEYAAYCPGEPGMTYYLLACLNDTSFLGCCSNYAGCSDGCYNAKYSNFTISALYEPDPQSFTSHIQNQTCELNSVWYSCPEKNVETNFIGCCNTDPCNVGCPTDDYARAFLSPYTEVAKFFYGLNASSMSFSISSTTSSTSTLTSSSTKTTSSTSVGSSSGSTTSSSASEPSLTYPTTTTAPEILQTASTPRTSVVVGSTVGGVAALILILGLVAYRVRRKAASRRSHLADFRASSSVWGGGAGGGGREEEGKAEGGLESNAPAVKAPSTKEPQEPSELTVLPPPSTPKLSTSTYTAYSRPFSELDASFITPQHPSSSPSRTAPSPPASRGESVAGAHATHPYPIPGAYSDGVGQAQ